MENEDIRQTVKKIDPAIEVFFALGNMVEIRRCILLQEYIHQTWLMEQELKKRVAYIETETAALAKVLHEITADDLV